MRGIGDIVTVLQGLLPPWALGLLAVAIVLWLVPRLRGSMRVKRARALLRQAARAAPSDRAGVVDAAFAAAGSDVEALAVLAQDAHTRTMPAVHKRAIAALEVTPDGRRAAHRVLRALGREQERTAFELAATIRSLVAEGRIDEARTRLADAHARWPGSADLSALDREIAERPVDAGDRLH